MSRDLVVGLLILILMAGLGFELRGLTHASAKREATASKRKVASAPSASCSREELRLRLPLNGTMDEDWVIANYNDLDPKAGEVRDYTGAVGEAALTYDGHSGVDIEIPGFRRMDQGFEVVASADGVVEETFDQSPDRNRTCSGEKWNYVKLRHANGFATLYGHMRRGSVAVQVGQQVVEGMKLGLVGSSGCSSYPHVHLEVLDCEGHVLDPMRDGLFAHPPPYSGAADAGLMELSVFEPPIDSVLSIQDGTGDVQSVGVGREFSVGVTISHLKRNDVLRIEFLAPDNSLAPFFFERRNDHSYPRTHWWGNFKLDRPGAWIVVVRVNGQPIGNRVLLAQ